ncbi:MAG: class D sortase [Ruminococcus sp.]|jgi:sortase A|nr:class D sortase [Ruminococcus sp.]
MSDKKRRHRHKKSDGKSFIILPIIFLFGTYLVLYLALAPSFSTLFSAAGMFFSDNEKDYSTEYKNIFVPVSENSTLPTVTKEDNKSYVKNDAVEYPNYGNQFGELIIEECGIDNKLFFGDGEVALRNGVGIYNGSFIPGYGRTILVAGHNNTYFNGLKYAEKGQTVVIRTSYGDYEYCITGTAVKKATDRSAYDLNADYENLIMYTCYPFDELGLTDYRFFVYAELVSGTPIDKSIGEGE